MMENYSFILLENLSNKFKNINYILTTYLKRQGNQYAVCSALVI